MAENTIASGNAPDIEDSSQQTSDPPSTTQQVPFDPKWAGASTGTSSSVVPKVKITTPAKMTKAQWYEEVAARKHRFDRLKQITDDSGRKLHPDDALRIATGVTQGEYRSDAEVGLQVVKALEQRDGGQIILPRPGTQVSRPPQVKPEEQIAIADSMKPHNEVDYIYNGNKHIWRNFDPITGLTLPKEQQPQIPKEAKITGRRVIPGSVIPTLQKEAEMEGKNAVEQILGPTFSDRNTGLMRSKHEAERQQKEFEKISKPSTFDNITTGMVSGFGSLINAPGLTKKQLGNAVEAYLNPKTAEDWTFSLTVDAALTAATAGSWADGATAAKGYC
jgi:hypothetical protein